MTFQSIPVHMPSWRKAPRERSVSPKLERLKGCDLTGSVKLFLESGTSCEKAQTEEDDQADNVGEGQVLSESTNETLEWDQEV